MDRTDKPATSVESSAEDDGPTQSAPQLIRESFEAVGVGGVPFVQSDLGTATRWLLDVASKKGSGINVRLGNAYNVALANSEPEYRRLLVGEGINFPDGAPVVWFMRLRAWSSRPNRVRGPSLFVRTLELSNASTRHFLLGGADATMLALKRVIEEKYPQLTLAGTYCPPFADLDEDYIETCVREIHGSRPDIVWIGLGTPKQDYVGSAIARRLGVLTVNVGAAFDFAAGTVREAPPWIQRSGFEWLYRLAMEPRRLWRRYFIGNAQFLIAAVRNSTLD